MFVLNKLLSSEASIQFQMKLISFDALDATKLFERLMCEVEFFWEVLFREGTTASV